MTDNFQQTRERCYLYAFLEIYVKKVMFRNSSKNASLVRFCIYEYIYHREFASLSPKSPTMSNHYLCLLPMPPTTHTTPPKGLYQTPPKQLFSIWRKTVTGAKSINQPRVNHSQGENCWETFNFRKNEPLEQQALHFLSRRRLKSALAPGLARKMHSMVVANLSHSSVDIVDLI